MGGNSTDGRLAAQPPRQHDRGSYLIAIGVMTRPHNFDRRAWMREHAPAPPELLMRFVLGRCLAADVSYLLDEEHRVYGDLHRFKHAKDGFRSAHVIKTYEWYIYAKGLDTRWVAKADDDTLWNVPLLLAELRLLTGKHAHAYHGVMRWRW